MSTDNVQPSVIKFIEYPAGSRFIGPGDDVVISAAKLEAYIAAETRKSRVDELSKYVHGVDAGVILSRIAELQKETEQTK